MRLNAWPWRMLLLSFAGLVLLTLLLLLADLAGLPKGVVNGFFLVVSIIGYAVIGMFCRTTHPDEYFVAGRRISAPLNGMATAADWISAASFIGLTGLLLSDGFVGDGQHPGGLAYLLGWTGGFCLLGFLFAAKLNQSQSITIPDFLGRRFDSAAVRWLAAWGAILCSSIYLVAQIYGIGLVASMLSGLTFELGVFLALGGVLFEQIMQQRPAVDAIFFCNDDLAHGALMAALRMGIAVPSQVAITGFNDLTGSDQMLPALTTVRTPRAQIGEAAAQMLLTLMRGEVPEAPQLDLGFEIVQRQSS